MGPLEVRIARIENRLKNTLQQLLSTQQEPDNQTVVVNELNAQMVVQARFSSTSKPLSIVTVTSSDIEIYGLPEPDLADFYADQIRDGLTRSYAQRQPGYVYRQLQRASIIGIAALAITAVLILMWKRMARRRRHLMTQIEDNKQAIKEFDPETAAEDPDPLNTLRQTEYQLRRRLNSFRLRSRLVQMAIIFCWLIAISLSLRLFPQTRILGALLIRQPTWLILLWLAILLASQLSHALTDRLLNQWARQGHSPSTQERTRRQQRLPTLSRTLKELETGLLIAIGVVLAFRISTFFSNFQLVASAGVLGLAASIGLQSLLQDATRGAMILWQDAFTVGDVVEIAAVSGYVEFLNLAVTQLRSSGGELVTLSNGQINTVKNMTKEWSRMDLTVDIAYASDVDKALHLMGQTLDGMMNDADWGEKILESPDILAIEHLSSSGITLKIRTKTAPMQQWNVSREYRRRLKQVLDQAEIEMGQPQQNIALQRTTVTQGPEKL
jgi:small conductance mechanosensitive channel